MRLMTVLKSGKVYLPVALSIIVLSLQVSVPPSSEAQTWQHNGPYGAEVTAVTLSQQNAFLIIIGTRNHGLWKSTDGGNLFEAINDGIPLLTDSSFNGPWWHGDFLTANCIAIDPADDQHVLAAFHNHDAPDGTAQLITSSDGGTTWTRIGETLPSCCSIDAIWIDPGNSNRIIIATDAPGGLFQSVDGGVIFTGIGNTVSSSEHFYTFVKQSPVDADLLYAGFASTGSGGSPYWGLYRSTDRGESWEAIYTEQPILDLAFDVNDSNVLDAVVYTSNMDRRLGHSDDGGFSWTLSNNNWTGVSSPYRNDLNDLFICNGGTIYKSVDDGTTWQPIGSDINSILALPHARLAQMTGNRSDRNSLLVGCEYGFFRSDDGGVTNLSANNGIDNVFINDIATDPLNDNTIYATALHGLWKSMDGGSSWDKLLTTYNLLDVDVSSNGLIYMITDRSILISEDQGSTWNGHTVQEAGELSKLEIDSDNNIVYIVGRTSLLYNYNDLFAKSTDNGNTWETSEYEPYTLNNIALNPYNNNVVYLCSADGLLRSGNRGINFENVCNYENVVDVKFISSLHIVFCTENRVYYSLDGGYHSITLAGIDSYPFEKILSLDISLTETDTTLYLGTTQGVFASEFGSDCWNRIVGPYDERVTALAIQPTTGNLLIGTNGSGIWLGSDLITSVDDPGPTTLPHSSSLDCSTYPNPFNNTVNVDFTLEKGSRCVIRIVNLLGETVEHRNLGFLANGQHRYALKMSDTSNANGVYFLRLETDGGVSTRKIVYLK